MKRTIQVMLVAAIAIDIAYWSIWFTHRSWLASAQTQAYYDFENAFPLADLWLGAACALALVALRRQRPSAVLWLICAGSAALYLGCMDLLYDLQHQIFGAGSGGGIEALIVGLTWVFAVTVLRWSWTNRDELLLTR